MDDFDSEYLEIFGGNRSVFNSLSEKISESIFRPLEETVCEHKNTGSFGEFCTDCGMSYTGGGCPHENTYQDNNGLYVCRDCNMEIEVLDFEPEWRFYGSSDNRFSKNPERCHRSRDNDRGISKVFTELDIEVPEVIISQVEKKYKLVVGNDTVRGNRRKAIIAACLFHSYKEFGEYRTSDYIRDLFNISRKQMSGGITKYYDTFPGARTIETRPEDLIRWILLRAGVSQEHYRKIVQICRYLENSSRLLKRSSPQSVASAVVYFYLCLNPEYKSQLGLTKNTFAEKALLSYITVTKLVKEAAEISNCLVECM